MTVGSRPPKAKRIAQVVTVALSLAATLAILVLPGYVTVSLDTDGTEIVSTASVLTVVGPSVLAVLTIPNLFAIAPLLARGRALQPVSIASAVLLAGFGVVSAATLGLYFVPAILGAIVAVFLPPRTSRS